MNKPNPFATPAGAAFAEILEREEFAEAVRRNPKETLAPFKLSRDEFDALVADANALDVDVEAFGMRDQSSFANKLGGLQMTGLLGITPKTVPEWTYSLTRT